MFPKLIIRAKTPQSSVDNTAVTGDNGTVMTIARQVRYSGRVQGVGFRYTTQRVARGFPVTGYVRNLPGGEVELVAEGEAEAVGMFLEAVAARMAGYIEHTEAVEIAPAGLSDFRIRH